MTAKTHIASSLSMGMGVVIYAAEVLNYSLSIFSLLVFLVGVFSGSLFPDIDEPSSKIGNKFKIVSEILSLFVKHRGVTHTFLIVLFYFVLGIWLANDISSFADSEPDIIHILFFGFILGNLFHIIGDMMTKGGVPFFWPISNKNIGLLPKSLRFYTFGIIEMFVVLPLFSMLFFAEAYWLFSRQLIIFS